MEAESKAQNGRYGPAAAPVEEVEEARGRGGLLWVLIVAAGAALVIGLYLLGVGRGPHEIAGGSDEARVNRGNLRITVLEGGTIVALESLDIKSEVEGQNRILSIVEEGTLITDKDVEEGKILVEMESSELVDRRSQEEMSFQSASAGLTQAQEGYQIQTQQNESNVALAELELKFSRMDLEHYLGEGPAARAIAGELDFGKLASEELGGSALQDRRDLEANLSIATEELTRAREELKWTRDLAEKKYVSGNELVEYELAEKRREIDVQRAEAALALFFRYEMPQRAEQFYSDYLEAERGLKRVHAKARSQMAQVEAELKSKEAAYGLQNERLQRLIKGIENCTIRATKPGLVIYSSTANPSRRNTEPIQEGFVVRERQSIIVLPNLSTLAVRLKVHESDIKMVRNGQPARITLDALTGHSFAGHVKKVSVLASSEDRWMNPDIMVFTTDVALDEQSPEIKPGMSASAEILIEELEDVLFVPIQAITTREGQRVCWVKSQAGPELRAVATGQFTETHVEIQDGLNEGEIVYLAPPLGADNTSVVQLAAADAPAREATPTEAQTPPAPPAETTSEAAEEVDEEPAEPGRDGMERWQNATPEERERMREEMRKRFENMSPEERQKATERAGGGRRGGGREGGDGGGEPRGGQPGD